MGFGVWGVRFRVWGALTNTLTITLTIDLTINSTITLTITLTINLTITLTITGETARGASLKVGVGVLGLDIMKRFRAGLVFKAHRLLHH